MVSIPTSVDARALLCAHMKTIYDMVEGTIADCSPEVANTWKDGWTAQPISVIYLHALCSDDYMVNEIAKGGARLYEAQGWQQRLGAVNMLYMEGVPPGSLTLDMSAVREYAAAVRAASDDFLANATEANLSRLVDNHMGGQIPVAEYLASYLGTHMSEHCGEIAALKGVLGLKGLPF